MVEWPEWLVLGISFVLLAGFSFSAMELASVMGITGNLEEYLVYAKFFGVIFVVMALASFVNLIISASREKIRREIKKHKKS